MLILPYSSYMRLVKRFSSLETEASATRIWSVEKVETWKIATPPPPPPPPKKKKKKTPKNKKKTYNIVYIFIHWSLLKLQMTSNATKKYSFGILRQSKSFEVFHITGVGLLETQVALLEVLQLTPEWFASLEQSSNLRQILETNTCSDLRLETLDECGYR